MTLPTLFIRDRHTWARLGSREVRLEPSSTDRRRRRYWRARDGTTDTLLTAWHFTPRIAAIVALTSPRSP